MFAIATIVFPQQAMAEEPVDIRELQTCLKQKGSSLDVLVLMDSSKSLRNSKPGENINKPTGIGSDPDDLRGKILLSSLSLLRDLAEDSGNSFRINLKNFGNNSGKFLDELKSKWIPWTPVTPDNSEKVLNDFVTNALFDDSPGTYWADGLATAKVDFSQRIYDAEQEGSKSCSIMFWITDGQASNPGLDEKAICNPGTESSIEWFRQKKILVLGGLLKPKGEDTSLFPRIVEGDNCGGKEKSWTQGKVIEASDINSLAWEFVSLVANIRNLVNLGISNNKVILDRGTSQLEFYIKGTPSEWELKAPDGSVYCSSRKVEPEKCLVTTDKEKKTGITSISVTPTDPDTTAGSWEFTSFPEAEVKVYGGLSVEPNPVNLVVDTPNQNIVEGKKASFNARLVNPDKTLFDVSSFQSVKICATLESNGEEVCQAGSASAIFELFPKESDTSIPFTATLVSKNGENRQYEFYAVINVTVQESGRFPSLVCRGDTEGDICKIPNLKNKSKKASVYLEVLKPTDLGAVSGEIYIVGYEITLDKYDRNFNFEFSDVNGNRIVPGDKTNLFSANETLKLEVSFDKGEASQIEGVIKYAVVADGQTVIRQLNFGFEVDDKINLLLLILLLLLAYALTIAVPYVFLLWSARRRASLNILDNTFSYVTSAFEITNQGKLVPIGENGIEETFKPDYKKMQEIKVEPRSNSVAFSVAKVEALPHKWNPFKPQTTKITIKDSYLLSSYVGKDFSFGSQSFNSEVIGEVVVYFDSIGNISPEKSSVGKEVIESPHGFDFTESDYESTLSNVIKSPQGPVRGNIIYLVDPYGDKEKSLADSVAVLKTLIANVDFSEQILKFRKDELDSALARIASEELAISKGKTPKGKGMGDENLPEIESEIDSSEAEEDEWGGSTSGSASRKKNESSDKKHNSWE
jgi:hypothetical protein